MKATAKAIMSWMLFTPSRQVMPSFRSLLLVSLWLLWLAPGQAQQEQTVNPHSVKAITISEPIKVDGILSEPAWDLAEPAADFRQEEPTEGAPASERTEVRVLYDARNIYFAIRAFDSDAAHISARELVRDANFSNDDKLRFFWILTTIGATSTFGRVTSTGPTATSTLSIIKARAPDSSGLPTVCNSRSPGILLSEGRPADWHVNKP